MNNATLDKLNPLIKTILKTDILSAEAANELHAATLGHPLCQTTDIVERARMVCFILAGRRLSPESLIALDRISRLAAKRSSLI